MFDGVEFPCKEELAPMMRDACRRRTAGISDLDTGLADVDRDDFTHDLREIGLKGGVDERGTREDASRTYWREARMGGGPDKVGPRV